MHGNKRGLKNLYFSAEIRQTTSSDGLADLRLCVNGNPHTLFPHEGQGAPKETDTTNITYSNSKPN